MVTDESNTYLGAWQVSWHEEKKRKKKCFQVHHFMKTGKTSSEAEADALLAAIEFRKGLERSGVVTVKAGSVDTPKSGVIGVKWNKRTNNWCAYIQVNGKEISGGSFKPKDTTPEEVERARLAAVVCRRKLEEKHFTIKESKVPDLDVVRPKSGVTGVSWAYFPAESRRKRTSKESH